MNSRIGQTISHYRILEKIGAGGMGVVYKAEDLKLRRIVAIKVLPVETAMHGEFRKRFLREAQSASSLNHPSICVVHEIDEVDGEMFIVMEYLDGKTLGQWIVDTTAKPGAIRRSDGLSILLQVGEGLERAHRAGIIHRDIKPDNIMILRDGRAKIMDFGLAKLEGASVLTTSKTTLGTMPYMSPEQLQGGKVDNRSDIYSLGVVAFEMLSGRRPIDAESFPALMYAVVHTQPPQLSSLVPGIDPFLNDIVMRCLGKSPSTRFPSMNDLTVALRKCSDFSSLTAETRTMPAAVPVSDAHPAGGPFRKKFILAGGIIVLLIIGWIVSRPLIVPPKAWLTVRGDPDSVTVIMDGKVIGRTPLTGYNMGPGPIVISLRRDHYQGKDTILTVAPGITTYVSFALTREERKEEPHPPATIASVDTIPRAKSPDELASLLTGTLSRITLTSTESVIILPLTYGNTQIGSQFSRFLKTLMESRLVEQSHWVVVQPDEDIQSRPSDGTLSRGPKATHVVKGEYYENKGVIEFVVSLQRLADGRLLASTVVVAGRDVVGPSHLELKPANFTQALKDEKVYSEGENNSDSLKLEVWTNKGKENLVFAKGERMRLSVRANMSCKLRVVYDLADGKRALLEDNDSYILDSSHKGSSKVIDDYACSAPFGVETLHVFARTEDFEPVQTVMEGRTRILKGDLKDFLYATRGMNKIDKSVKQAEAKLILTTIDALRSR